MKKKASPSQADTPVETKEKAQKKYIVSCLEIHENDSSKGLHIIHICESEEEANKVVWSDMLDTLCECGDGCFFGERHISYSNLEFWWYINEIAA